MAGDIELAYAALRKVMVDNWATTQVAWQNMNFVPPDSDPWVFIEILTGEAEYVSMGVPGANLHRHPGVVRVHIFVPAGTGDGTALLYARQIADLYRGQQLPTTGANNVVTKAASIGGGRAADDEGKWWRRTVTVDWRYDEFA